MNTTVYEKNLESLGNWVDTWETFFREKRYEEKNEEEKEYETDGIEIVCEQSLSGVPVFSVIDKTGRRLYLSGKYAPEEMAGEWIEENELKGKNAEIIILGMGDGSFLKEVLRQTAKETRVLVYEPCRDIFIKAVQEVDLTEVFDSKRVGLVVEGMNGEEWKALVQSKVQIERIAGTYIYVNANYRKLFSGKIREKLKIVSECLILMRSHWNTVLRYTAYSGMNLIPNLKYLLEGYTINRLYHVLPETFPCIIVAAGPSLNKNIEELKKVQKRACIIACDTAMKPLLSRGIVPDFFLVVDAKKPKLLLDYPGVERVPFVTTLEVPHDIMEFHQAEKFFYFCGEEIFRKAVDIGFQDRKKPVSIDEGVSGLNTGGSVATSAYCLAEYMGSRTMILIGQDLGFPGNKSHADGTFDDKMEEMDYISNFPLVEDINGEMIHTAPDMKAYLSWYEEEFTAHPDYTVIDATEGGAKIKGTKIMTLSEAIAEYCHQEIDIKWHISQIPQMFEPHEKEYVAEYFKSLPEKAHKVLVWIRKVKQGYRKLQKLAVQKHKDEEIAKLSKKLSKEVKRLEEDEIYLLMVDFMAGYEYTLRATMNQEEEDELLSAAKQGEVYLNSMEQMMNLVIPVLEEEFA